MSVLEWLSVGLCLLGAFFFAAGTIGLLRFPDSFCRLHALTKADNLGLGFIILGLCVQTFSVSASLKLIFIWLLTLLASSSICYFLGRHAFYRKGAKDR